MIIFLAPFIPFHGIYKNIAEDQLSQSLAHIKMTNSVLRITETCNGDNWIGAKYLGCYSS